MTFRRLLVLATLTAAGTAAAAEPHGTALSPQQLDHLRGGFILPGGVVADFAADMRSFVDGRLVLETSLALQDGGWIGSGPANAVLPQGDSLTTVMHRINEGQLAALAINDANGRDIRQHIGLTMTLTNLPQLQSLWREQLFIARTHAAAH